MRLNYTTILVILILTVLVPQTRQVYCLSSLGQTSAGQPDDANLLQVLARESPLTPGDDHDQDDSQIDDQYDQEWQSELQSTLQDTTSSEIYLLEDKEYPRSLFEDYSKQVGQVSGVAAMPGGDVVIFHRADRRWTNDTFDEQTMRVRSTGAAQEKLIKNDTIMILDRSEGSSVATFGSDLFYMPHGVASDRHGNLWLSDVARHQVMRIPGQAIREARQSTSNKTMIWPDIILGQAFEPGDDANHFCQPSEVAVSPDGRLVFVADGYCNQRVVVFTGQGKYLTSFGRAQGMLVVHSLTLVVERNLVCVADRENGRILCFRAGLDGDLARLGEFVYGIKYPIGKVYALVSLDKDHLLVSSRQVQPSSSRYDLSILNPFKQELKLVWTSSDLLEPHSLARTMDGQFAYAADISQDAYKKVFKFNVITRGQSVD